MPGRSGGCTLSAYTCCEASRQTLLVWPISIHAGFSMDTCIDQPIAATATVASRLRNSWSQLLDVTADQITADGNFFALGGNSMLVLSLHVTVATEFNITMTL